MNNEKKIVQIKAVSYKNDVAFWDPSQINAILSRFLNKEMTFLGTQKNELYGSKNHEICEGSQKATSFLYETAFSHVKMNNIS